MNTWLHIVGSQDAGGTMTLYVNGRLVASGTAAGPIPGLVTRSINYIGRSAQSLSDRTFIGTIDEVAIYGHGLTSAQVQAHYLTGRPEGQPPASDYANAVMADAPTVYWRLDDPTLPVARDVTATRDAMHVGPVSLSQPGALVGGDGASLGLGQPGGYVDLQPDQTNFSNGLTVEAWIKPTEVRGWARAFILNNSPNGSGNQGIGLLRNAGSNDLMFAIPSAGLTAPGALTLNTWRHVVGTVTAQGYATLYVDGQIVTAGQAQPVATTLRGVGHIGRSDWDRDPTWAGGIDEVALYNHPLSAERVAAHYAIGRGAPLPPVVEVSAAENPIAISWTPRDGVVKYDLWYTVGDSPESKLSEFGPSTTSLGLHVGDDTSYRFRVEATGETGYASSSVPVSIVTDFGGESDEPDMHPDLFDPAAEPLCIPTADPNNPSALIQQLLLTHLLCGATQQQTTWQQADPPSRLLCPVGILPLPGDVILSRNDPVCLIPGTDTVQIGDRPGEGPVQRAQATGQDVKQKAGGYLPDPNVPGSSLADVTNGVDKVTQTIASLAARSKWRWVLALGVQLTRLDVYAASQRLYAVEQRLPTGRIPDGLIRLASGSGTNPPQHLGYLEVKHWKNSTLSSLRSQTELVRQLTGYFQASEDRFVLLEFVQVKKDPVVRSAQEIVNLLVAQGLDPAYRSRLMVRIVDGVLDPGVIQFVATVP